jgi:hypothetical protein
VCEDGLFIPGFVVHHAHGEKMERVKHKGERIVAFSWQQRLRETRHNPTLYVHCLPFVLEVILHCCCFKFVMPEKFPLF